MTGKLRIYVPGAQVKEMVTDVVLGGISDIVKTLHPTDKVECLRDIAGRCGAAADAAQEYNEEHGVPERAEDQE